MKVYRKKNILLLVFVISVIMCALCAIELSSLKHISHIADERVPQNSGSITSNDVHNFEVVADISDFSDKSSFESEWRSGNYTHYDGLYEPYSSRVSHIQYDSVVAGRDYKVRISDDAFSMLVRELDANYSFIQSSTCQDGCVLTLSDKTTYVGITLYCPTNSKLTYEDYRDLFNDGLQVSFSLDWDEKASINAVRTILNEMILKKEDSDYDIWSYYLSKDQVSEIYQDISLEVPVNDILFDMTYDTCQIVKTVSVKYDKKEEYVNVLEHGVNGTGESDDSTAIMNIDADNLYFPDGTYSIDISCARYLNSKNILGDGKFVISPWSNQWCKYTNIAGNIYDGTCSIQHIDDELYRAAHWVSEADMTEDERTNLVASTIYSLSEDNPDINYQGFVVRVKDKEVPDEFTFCIGKCKLYAYKNGKWELLNESYPTFSLYDASWKDGNNIAIKQNRVEYDDHVEITITKEQWYAFSANDERIFHYWGPSYVLEENEDASQYQYFLTLSNFWIKEPEYEDIFGFKIGSDLRDKNGTIHELGLGNLLLLKSYPRTAYFYTVPDDLYDTVLKGYSF